MKAVQFFTDDYLAQCAKMTPTEIALFLDDFRRIHSVNNRREQSDLAFCDLNSPPKSEEPQ